MTRRPGHHDARWTAWRSSGPRGRRAWICPSCSSPPGTASPTGSPAWTPGPTTTLIKPFDFDELLARIRSMTRKRSSHTSSVLTVGDLTWTPAATPPGGGIGSSTCPPGVRHPGVLSHEPRHRPLPERNRESHLNYDYSGGTNVVDVYISYLRKKIDGGCDKN